MPSLRREKLMYSTEGDGKFKAAVITAELKLHIHLKWDFSERLFWAL